MIAAQKSVIVLALFFIASGAADVVYALHGHVWSQILQTIFFAMLNLLGGVALLLDTSVAATWAGSLFGYALAVNGVSRMVVALAKPAIEELAGLTTCRFRIVDWSSAPSHAYGG
jgi:hypothetical protein